MAVIFSNGADKPSRMPASSFDLVQATVRLAGEQIAPDTVCAIGAIAGDEAGLDLAGSSSLWDLALGERLSQAWKPDTLIALNINQHYRQIVQSLERGGKIVLLRSGEHEFIMGEGYLNTLAGYTVELQHRCLVPLTPTLAVLAFASSRYWAADSPICTIGLTAAELNIINEVTQIYSRDYVFFRNEAPKLIDAFTAREFRIVQYHRFEWLDRMMQAVAGYAPKRNIL